MFDALTRRQQIEGLHRTNTLDVHHPSILESKFFLQNLIDHFTNLDRICGSTRLHPTRNIHGVAPKVVRKLAFPDDASDDGAQALFVKLRAEDPDDACVALHLARMEDGARDAIVVMESK